MDYVSDKVKVKSKHDFVCIKIEFEEFQGFEGSITNIQDISNFFYS